MTFKLTRQRVILGGFMLAALVGLLADRFVFAAPPTDDASDDTSPPPRAASDVRAASGPHAAAKPLTPEAILAARLNTLAGPMPQGGDDLRDVFTAAAPLAASVEPASAPSMPDPERVTAEAIQQRARWQTRTLGGVILRSDGRKIAIIDGRMVPLGATYDGLRLAQLSQDAAVFTDGHSQLTLRPARAEKTE